MKIHLGVLMSSGLLLGASFFSQALALSKSSEKGQMVVSTNITEAEVRKAQEAWGEALVKISDEYSKKGIKAARRLADKIIDSAYGYQFGTVLFKPTLANGDQTFRTSKEGALAYFVGHNSKFPNDTGFALKGWKKVDLKKVAFFISGDVAMTMGNVDFTDSTGKVTRVDKTWGFKKDDQGVVRIVLHHSSLPYSP